MTAKDIAMYRSDDGTVQLEVSVNGDTVWLTQAQMAELFGTGSQAITKHVRNILADGELDDATCSKMEQVRREGSRTVKRMVNVYNLDMVISVGYRLVFADHAEDGAHDLDAVAYRVELGDGAFRPVAEADAPIGTCLRIFRLHVILVSFVRFTGGVYGGA